MAAPAVLFFSRELFAVGAFGVLFESDRAVRVAGGEAFERFAERVGVGRGVDRADPGPGPLQLHVQLVGSHRFTTLHYFRGWAAISIRPAYCDKTEISGQGARCFSAGEDSVKRLDGFLSTWFDIGRQVCICTAPHFENRSGSFGDRYGTRS